MYSLRDDPLDRELFALIVVLLLQQVRRWILQGKYICQWDWLGRERGGDFGHYMYLERAEGMVYFWKRLPQNAVADFSSSTAVAYEVAV